VREQVTRRAVWPAVMTGTSRFVGLVHRLGRSMLAPMFVTGGLDAIRHPESKESFLKKIAMLGGLVLITTDRDR
jgi:hypothetical protein